MANVVFNQKLAFKYHFTSGRFTRFRKRY